MSSQHLYLYFPDSAELSPRDDMYFCREYVPSAGDVITIKGRDYTVSGRKYTYDDSTDKAHLTGLILR